MGVTDNPIWSGLSFWVQCMVQGLWPLIFWWYSWPDRYVPYGVPIIILSHQISSWYNGGFSISCSPSFYHRYSTAESVAVLKRARVEWENVLPFWRSNAQHLCHQEGTCSIHIPCVRYRLQLWRVILCWLLTAEWGSCSEILIRLWLQYQMIPPITALLDHWTC